MITLQDIFYGSIFKNGDSLIQVTPSNVDWVTQQVQSNNCQLEGVELTVKVLASMNFDVRMEEQLPSRAVIGELKEPFYRFEMSILFSSIGEWVLNELTKFRYLHEIQQYYYATIRKPISINLPALEKALGMKVVNEIDREIVCAHRGKYYPDVPFCPSQDCEN